MESKHASATQPESVEQPISTPEELEIKWTYVKVSRLDGVQAKPKPEAECCGAIGCRLNSQLMQVGIHGYGRRVVCPDHLEALVEREVGLDG